MAASKGSGTVAVAAAIRSFVQQVVADELEKGSHRSSLVRELRQISHALAKLERRVESMQEKMPGRTAKSTSTRGPGRPPTHENCTVRGCKEHHYARGLCSRHYQQHRRAERGQRKRR